MTKINPPQTAFQDSIKQPEALRLAEGLEGVYAYALLAAAELRNLHAKVEAMRQALLGSEGTVFQTTSQRDALRSEVDRLNKCLRYEQHRGERIGTHGKEDAPANTEDEE